MVMRPVPVVVEEEVAVTSSPSFEITDGEGNPQVLETTANTVVYVKNSLGVPVAFETTTNPIVQIPDNFFTPPPPPVF